MEVGVAHLEGALKYGRFNWRGAGVRASVYVDAAEGHLAAWKMGEDEDPDTGLSHLVKAVACLLILRDAQMHDMLNDDRGPKADLAALRERLGARVDELFDKFPEPPEPWTQARFLSECDPREKPLGPSSIWGSGTPTPGDKVLVAFPGATQHEKTFCRAWVVAFDPLTREIVAELENNKHLRRFGSSHWLLIRPLPGSEGV